MRTKILFLILLILPVTAFALSPSVKLEKKIYHYQVMCTCGFDFGYKYTEHTCPDNMVSHTMCDKCYLLCCKEANIPPNPKLLFKIRKDMQKIYDVKNAKILNETIVGGYKDNKIIEYRENGLVWLEVETNESWMKPYTIIDLGDDTQKIYEDYYSKSRHVKFNKAILKSV